MPEMSGEIEIERDRALVAGAGPDGELHPAQDLVRLLPGGKRSRLVGADDEVGVAEAAAADRVHGVRVRVEHDLPQALERGPGHAEPVFCARNGVLVARALRDQNDETLDGQLLERRPREGDVAVVRGIEPPAEEPDQPSSMRSSPISISAPGRAPAARRAASSSA